MKHIALPILLLVFFLSACSGGKSEDELSLVLNIPESYEIYDTPSEIRVDGNVVELSGKLLKSGDTLTSVTLDMRADYFNEVESIQLSERGGLKLLQTVPSLDTPVCTFQTRQLEAAAQKYHDIQFITISNDTPFALQRFCSANNIDNLITLSDARTRAFGLQNNFLLPDFGLLLRSIMIVDENLEILYIEYAEEVTDELNLENALAFLQSIE